jgi:hypothetical protein
MIESDIVIGRMGLAFHSKVQPIGLAVDEWIARLLDIAIFAKCREVLVHHANDARPRKYFYLQSVPKESFLDAVTLAAAIAPVSRPHIGDLLFNGSDGRLG